MSKPTKNLEKKYKYNKVVWKDTYRISDKYPHLMAIKINKINENEFNQIKTKLNIKKIIKIFNEDLITTIETVVNAKFKPLVLINANDNYPLENVKYGLISPEYDLYRYSNINTVIMDTLYPVRDLEMIYCSKITIFKNLNNKLLKKPYQIALILVPSIKRPNLMSIKNDKGTEDVYSNPTDENNMKNKIENIFKLAIINGYNCLILTDFGCQIENNPINKIIEFFNTAIKKYPIKYVFFSVNNENFEYFHTYIKRNV